MDGRDSYSALDEAFGSSKRDPYPRLAELRAQCPVVEGTLNELFDADAPIMAALVGVPRVVLGYDAANTVFRDADTYSSRPEAIPLFYEMMGPTMIQMDNPEHRRARGLVAQAFARKAMDRWERELARPIVSGLIDAFVDRGRAELVREFTLQFPSAVIGGMLGLPPDEIAWLHEKGADIMRFDDLDIARGASRALGERFAMIVEERRRNPLDDITGLLVAARLDNGDQGDGPTTLSTDEIVSAMRQIFRAGVDTTYRASSNMLFGLLTHPEQLKAVVDDHSLITNAIEEALRWEAPLLFIPRIADSDGVVEGQTIPEESRVQICIGAANRDDTRFERPDEFDIFRPQHPHLAFGAGPHICVGMHLARMEMGVALEAVLDRLPNVRLDPSADDIHIGGVMHRTPQSLPVLFDVS
jgi:cytochrome P450